MTAEASLVGHRILIVEDEYFLAEDLVSAVESRSAQAVGPISTVDQALALLAQPEVVEAAVLDVNLHGEAVFPVAAVLRGRGIPFVFLFAGRQRRES